MEGGVAETQCALLLAFLRAAAVKGSVIPFEASYLGSVLPFDASDLEFIALDKVLEAQRMEILRRDLPARFDVGALVGPSAGEAMTLALSAFEARIDMLERTRAAINGAPREVIIKKPEERWGAVLEGALRMH